MFSYLFMKILETRPASYDRRVNRLTGGRIAAVKEAIASEIPSGARVLEIGCGTGELAAMLVSRGVIVDGFDLSPAMVAVAAERIESEGLQGRFSVKLMGVDGMDDLPELSYDGVVATLVLSELSNDERGFTLRHTYRVLKPGGILAVADEVLPRSAVGRAAQALIRIPMLVAVHLVTGTSTRPLADLPGEVAAAGFSIRREIRSHGDAFEILLAERPLHRGVP